MVLLPTDGHTSRWQEGKPSRRQPPSKSTQHWRLVAKGLNHEDWAERGRCLDGETSMRLKYV